MKKVEKISPKLVVNRKKEGISQVPKTQKFQRKARFRTPSTSQFPKDSAVWIRFTALSFGNSAEERSETALSF